MVCYGSSVEWLVVLYYGFNVTRAHYTSIATVSSPAFFPGIQHVLEYSCTVARAEAVMAAAAFRQVQTSSRCQTNPQIHVYSFISSVSLSL